MSEIAKPCVLVDAEKFVCEGECVPVAGTTRMTWVQMYITNTELYAEGSKYVWLECGEA